MSKTVYVHTHFAVQAKMERERANSKKTTKRSKEKFGSFFFSVSPVLKPHPNSSNNQGNSFFTCLIFIFIVFVMNLGHTQINDDCRDNRHQKQNKKQLLASIHRSRAWI